MMLLALLGCLLLALYSYSCTTVAFNVEASDMSHAQAWADELEASLCPLQKIVDLGIAPNPWAMPPKLALLLAWAEEDSVPATVRCPEYVPLRCAA